MKNNKKSGLLLFVAGIVLSVLGLFLVLFPLEEYSANMKIMSLSFIFIGVCYILSFAFNRKWLFRPGWTLSQGFYLMLMGMLCLYSFDNELSDSMNIVFALWALSTSTSQISSALKLRSLEFLKWYRILIYGFINLIFFAYFIIEPLTNYITLYTSFGIYIMVSGLICFTEPFNYKSTLK